MVRVQASVRTDDAHYLTYFCDILFCVPRGFMVITMDNHGLSMDHHGKSMECSWTVHVPTIDCPWTNHELFMDPPWTHHGPPWTLHASPWTAHGTTMDFASTRHGLSMDHHGLFMEPPRIVHRMPMKQSMEPPWTVRCGSMESPW